MKKVFLSLFMSFIFSVMVNAAMIDKNSVDVKFEGFKTPQMIGLEGRFNDIKYTFNNDTSSISSMLKGATAVIKTASLDTGVEEANKNLIGAFFQTLIGNSDIKVTFKDVIEGENLGVIMAYVNMGPKRSALLPLTYVIKDGKLEATGQLNLDSFKNSRKALAALSKAAPGHAGISWPLVNITFTANVIE